MAFCCAWTANPIKDARLCLLLSFDGPVNHKLLVDHKRRPENKDTKKPRYNLFCFFL